MRLRHLTFSPQSLCAVVALAVHSVIGTSAFAKQISIQDLIEHDPLGYECIPSSYLEESDDGVAAIAFSLTGKSRLPRTCLPDPCARALTPRELSNITGTEVIFARFSGEWDDYISRYADFCRAEVVFPKPRLDPVWANRAPVPGIAIAPATDPVNDFWSPLIEQARISRTQTPAARRQGLPVAVGLINPPDWGIVRRPGDAPVVQTIGMRTIRMMTSAGGSGGQEQTPATPDPVDPVPAPVPAPVPLPASGLLLLGALALPLQRRGPFAG